MIWLIAIILLAVAAYFLMQAFGEKNQLKSQTNSSNRQEKSDQLSNEPNGRSDAGAGVAGAIGAIGVKNAIQSSAIAHNEPGSTSTNISAVPDSGDALIDVREMLKILNLRQSDASRLGIDQDQYNSIKGGAAGGLDGNQVQGVAERLQKMLG